MSQNSPFTPGLQAGGTIRPFRAVKLSTAADWTGLEADANEAVIGITDGNTRGPVTDVDATPAAAIDGDQISLQSGALLEIEYGGDVVRGDNLKSDADGKAVAAATTGTTVQNIFAKAVESGASGTIGKVIWQPLAIRPALV